MRFFRKKVTLEDFSRFEISVHESFEKIKRHNQDLEKQLSVITQVTMALCPLSVRFTELQRQFTEFVNEHQKEHEQFSELMSEQHYEKEPENSTTILNENNCEMEQVGSSVKRNEPNKLTQLEQKALIFIGKLQNEAGSAKIPVGLLTTNLYPNQVNRRIKTTVSNILKTLANAKLILRERQGNHWFIGLTPSGFQQLRNLLNTNQLANLVQLYEKPLSN